MCCFTHPFVLAVDVEHDDRFRCRCPVDTAFGPCRRKMTQEDLLCDVCGGRAPYPADAHPYAVPQFGPIELPADLPEKIDLQVQLSDTERRWIAERWRPFAKPNTAEPTINPEDFR